jgi:hypothetical protein
MARHAARGNATALRVKPLPHPAPVSVSGSAVKVIPLCSIGSLHSSRFTPLSLTTSGERASSRREWPKASRPTREAPDKRCRRLLDVSWQSAPSGFRRDRVAACYIYRRSWRRDCGNQYTVIQHSSEFEYVKAAYWSQTKKGIATKRHTVRFLTTECCTLYWLPAKDQRPIVTTIDAMFVLSCETIPIRRKIN